MFRDIFGFLLGPISGNVIPIKWSCLKQRVILKDGRCGATMELYEQAASRRMEMMI